MAVRGKGEGGLERGPGRELYRHYVTASSRAVAIERGPGLLQCMGSYVTAREVEGGGVRREGGPQN